MAVYRFRVTFEDYDDVTREIDIKSNQTFIDLHRAIHQATGYPVETPSSFYISNDFWIKGQEFTFLPNDRRQKQEVPLMENAKLSSHIDDPHQKFYYTYNFDRPFDFHVELIKILDDEPGKQYPSVFRATGEIPKLRTAGGPIILPPTNEDFDFLNDMEYNPEDQEELSAMGDMGINAEESEESEAEEEEKDEFEDEFSDNENFDSDDQREEY